MKKCPSSIQCLNSKPQPLECESHPITTGPGLPPFPEVFLIKNLIHHESSFFPVRRNFVKSGRRSGPARHQPSQHSVDTRRHKHVGRFDGAKDEEEQRRQQRQRLREEAAEEEEEPEGAGGELDQQHHGY